jgi:hypothetical protein
MCCHIKLCEVGLIIRMEIHNIWNEIAYKNNNLIYPYLHIMGHSAIITFCLSTVFSYERLKQEYRFGVVLFCAYAQDIQLFFSVKTAEMNRKSNMEMSGPSCNSHAML